MKANQHKPRIIPKSLPAVALTLLLGATTQIHATQVVRELWDGAGKVSIQGLGNTVSSLGFDTNTTWAVSPPGNLGFQLDGTWNLDDWMGLFWGITLEVVEPLRSTA